MLVGKNNFVIITRDKTEVEKGGFTIPDQGKIKPHSGIIKTIGTTAQDKSIKKGQRAVFHPTVGWEIEWQGITYVVMEAEKIIGIDS